MRRYFSVEFIELIMISQLRQRRDVNVCVRARPHPTFLPRTYPIERDEFRSHYRAAKMAA